MIKWTYYFIGPLLTIHRILIKTSVLIVSLGIWEQQKEIKDKIEENKKTNKKRVNSLIPPGGVEPPTLREWTTLSSRRVHRILRRLVCLKKRLTIQNYFINTPEVSFKYPEF